MNFARKQLEKYGWTDGKGLGKHENGISEALKPKLKRSVTGIGHNAAEEFTEHWWTKLYNTAASNVEVKEKNGKTKKIQCKDDDFEITNSTWSYKKKNKSKCKEEYTNFFVKTSILTHDGVNTEDLEESENLVCGNNGDIVKLTDEELFAACEGRTAHKGARHGLKALGKLARIEEQEQILLRETKYNDYSKKKKQKLNYVVEDTSLINNSKEKKKKKNKKHHCSDVEDNECTNNFKQMTGNKNEELEANLYNTTDTINVECAKIKKSKTHSIKLQASETIDENAPAVLKKKKIKKSKENAGEFVDSDPVKSSSDAAPIRNEDSNNIISGHKRKYSETDELESLIEKPKKSKKKKCK